MPSKFSGLATLTGTPIIALATSRMPGSAAVPPVSTIPAGSGQNPVVVKLCVYDLTGRKVKTLVSEKWRPGSFSVTWDGTDALSRSVASGIYFYRLEAGSFNSTRRMMLVR